MTVFHVLLLVATLLCSLVAGFLFAFAVVVMPGIRRLDDRGFIRAFQEIDGVIQNNQPLFVLVWLGSVLCAVAAGALSLSALGGLERVLLIIAVLVYVLGVQVPTFVVNVPLNNRLQKLDAETMAERERKRAREEFEPRWNKWNSIRTVLAAVASILFLLVLAVISPAASG